jgi:hypothetical protein
MKRAAVAGRDAYDESLLPAGSIVPSDFYVHAVLNVRLDTSSAKCS